MNRFHCLILLLTALGFSVEADHKPQAAWSWHVLSSGVSESRVSIYRREQLHGIYSFSCDLTDASEGDRNGSSASLDLVRLDSRPEGLLLISCNLGAHSQQVNIVDLASKSNLPVLSRTGSYVSTWEIQDGELWLSYDQPCETGLSVECPDGFETVFEQYPQP